MKMVLVTGSDGFIGKNIIEALSRREDIRLRTFDVGDSHKDLYTYLEEADTIYHLAGVNRSEKIDDFEKVNFGLTKDIVGHLERLGCRPTIVLSSSTQAALDNPYGVSKKRAEETLITYAERNNTSVYIYRLPNVFGKWCRPNYNSVVATFCYNVAHGLIINITDAKKELQLVYIDDVVNSFLSKLEQNSATSLCSIEAVNPVYSITLGALAEKIYAFHDIRHSLVVPDFSDRFMKCLYGTYLSYLPEDDFCYDLPQISDHRGKLAELLKSLNFGQIFISRTPTGVTRGNHYHNTKAEKFCILEGEAIVRFRHILSKEIKSYRVSGSEFKVLEISPGYAHSISNTGDKEMIVLFWADEIFDPQVPDTYYCEVET